MEATGRYEQPLFEALTRRSIPCSVVNPAHAFSFRKSIGKLAKTDAIDARLLARMGHSLTPARTPPPSRERQNLEALVLRRTQLRKMETAEINHAEHVSNTQSLKSNSRVRKFLGDEIKKIDKAIAKATAESSELAESSRRLQSVPGIGPTVAAGLLVHLPELGTVDKREIAALAGLAPFNVDSGASQGKRAIRAGRTPIRSLLYMAALVASRYNPRFRTLYARMLANGKPKKVALVAIARKLLIVLNALLKNADTWRPDDPAEPVM